MVIINILIDDEQHAVRKWPAVPGIGARMLVGVHGGPNAFHVVVKDVLWFQNTNGELAVDMTCERIKVAKASKK